MNTTTLSWFQPKGFLYDYDSKYKSDGSSYTVPAEIGDVTSRKIANDALTIYKEISCRHYARIDFLLKDNKYFYCPAFASKIVDKVGAGDSMLSIVSLLMKLKFKSNISLFLGSLAASLSVEEMSNKVPISKIKLLKYFNHIIK